MKIEQTYKNRVDQFRSPHVFAFLLVVLLSAIGINAQTITTIAGEGSPDGPALQAPLGDAADFAVASNGDLFIASRRLHRILKLNRATNTITTVAGTSTPGCSGDSISAASASILAPFGITFDPHGNIIFTEPGCRRIRRINVTTGVISTVAGVFSPAPQPPSPDGTLAAEAFLQNLSFLTVDSSGNIFFVENMRIRRIDASTGILTTVAGTQNSFLFNGDGIPATTANISPVGIIIDTSGNLIIADANNRRIRKVDANGIITTIAGTGSSGSIFNGPATSVNINGPQSVTLDNAGNILIVDSGRVRRLDLSTGNITTIAGGGTTFLNSDSHAISPTSANISQAFDAAFDSAGDLFILTLNDPISRILRVNAATNLVSYFAGNNTGFKGNGILATGAVTLNPRAVVTDGSGAIHVSNLFATSRILPNGIFVTMPRYTPLAKDNNGNLIISTSSNVLQRLNVLTGAITFVAGNFSAGSTGDGGPATSAGLSQVKAATVDSVGNIFIVDGLRIRRIEAATNIITTIAGTGSSGYNGDGIQAVGANMNPVSIAVDSAGRLIIADQSSNRIRRVENGIITTVANLGGLRSLVVDSGNNILVSAAPFVFRVDTAGGVTPIVGSTTATAFDSGLTGTIPAASATLSDPYFISLDNEGRLLIADAGLNRIRRVNFGNDTTAPVIAPTITGTMGNNGFYTSDVTINWNVNDGDSSISSSSGCDTTTITSDTAGTTYTCSATSTGGTSSQSVTVKRDVTPPTLTFAAASPAANATGWHTSDVSFAFTTNDATSGVASTSSPSPIVLTAENYSVGIGVLVFDNAGNVASFYHPDVKIDKTPPVLLGLTNNIVSSSSTVAVNYDVSVTDNLSNNAIYTVAVNCNPASGSAFALGMTNVTCNAVDAAGNAAATKVFQVYVLEPNKEATPTGEDVTVQQSDTGTELTFDNVVSPGVTTVEPIADPSEAGAIPGNFVIAELAFNISTTASFSGSVISCFNVTTVNNEADFNDLRVLHLENGVLVDRTFSRDFANRKICAETTSFSPFYLTKIGNKVKPVFDQSRAYNSGSTIPIRVQMLNANNLNISSENLVLNVRNLRRIGSNTSLSAVSPGGSNPDNNFRYGAGDYRYNLKTTGLSSGRYVLSFYAGEDRSFFYTVEFEVR